MHWDGSLGFATLIALAGLIVVLLKTNSELKKSSQESIKAREESVKARVAYEKDLDWRVSNLEVWRREQMKWTEDQRVIHSALENTVSGLQSVVKMLTKSL